MVIDRLQLYIFFLVTAAGTVGILLDAPHIFQYVDQDAVIEMHKGKATRWDKYGQVWACSFPPINGYYVASEQTTIILCSISAHFARLKIWSYMHRSLLVILKIKKRKHIAVYFLKGYATKQLFCCSRIEAYASPKFFVSTRTTKAMKMRVQVRIEEKDSICTRSTDSLIMHLMFLGVFDVVHSILRGNLAIVKPDWMRSRLSGEFYTCFVSSTLKNNFKMCSLKRSAICLNILTNQLR